LRIGIFDSGIGGLSVAKSIIEANIFEDIIYYGDSARVPYGVKDFETIIKYSLEAIDFFEPKDIDLLICACNSVSACAIEPMRNKASFDVYGVIESGIIATTQYAKKDDNILILGTTATTKSKIYENELHKLGFKNTISLATPLFVPLVEEGLINGDILDATLKHYFNGIKDIDCIILGCTHFPFIEKEITKYFHNKKSIHSGESIVEYLKQNHKIVDNQTKSVSIFASDHQESMREIAKKWINLSDLI